jgi:proton-coupled amino acid transporter
VKSLNARSKSIQLEQLTKSSSTTRVVGGHSKLRAAADAAAFPPSSEPADSGSKLTDGAAVASCAKAVMGAGCFALPWAFANGGLLLTTVSLLFMCTICLKTVHFMFKARDAAVALPGASKTLSEVENYVDVSDVTLGGLGCQVVRVIMCLTCFGVCSAYLVFVASTFTTIAVSYSLPAVFQNEKSMVYLISPLMILLGWMRSISGVSLISIFGNISVLVGMSFVLADALKNPIVLSSLPLAVPSNFAAYAGSCAFLFLVHFALPDIEANMANRKNFNSSAAKAYALCALVCLTFGGIGAIGYGPQVKSVAVAMLEGGLIAVAVKLLLCANVFATFPLIVRSSFTTIEDAFGGMTYTASNIMRASYVMAAAFCGASIPSFGKLVGLVGGVACTALGMTMPVIMLYLVHKRSMEKVGKPVMTTFEKVISPFILILSFIVMRFVVATS